MNFLTFWIITQQAYSSATIFLSRSGIGLSWNLNCFPDANQIEKRFETTPVWIIAFVFTASGLTTLLTSVVLLFVICATVMNPR